MKYWDEKSKKLLTKEEKEQLDKVELMQQEDEGKEPESTGETKSSKEKK